MGLVSRWVVVVLTCSVVACGTNKSSGATASGAAGKQAAAGAGGATATAGRASAASGSGATATAGTGSAAAGSGATATAGTGSAKAGSGGSGGSGGAADGGVDGGAAAGSGSDGGSGAAIPCTDAEWTAQCGSSCPFAPTQIDCAAACKNLPSVCTANCPQCAGVSLDTASCMAGCALYKGVTCYNRLLGCFVSNSTCETVTACANAHH
ncbi:MAG TPA: hypothetical protein VF331_08515 [Polyangiales bacterium]